MTNPVEIIAEDPFADGVAAGRSLGRAAVVRETRAALTDPLLADSLGAMAEKELHGYVVSRLETELDYVPYPELEDIYPERVERLRGLAEGADCSLVQAATLDYLRYRLEIDGWWRSLNPVGAGGHCSGMLLLGPDGVLGGQSKESVPLVPRPDDYRYRRPRPYRGLKQKSVLRQSPVVVRPRTGYVENWGTTNECGVGCAGSSSCSVWLDEPIEDSWPIKRVPLRRFARNVAEVEELYRRYTLFNWARNSEIWADLSGEAIVVEKGFRRIGIRHLEGATALWCTEGHFQGDEMSAYIREGRLAYVKQIGGHLGAGDLQYAHDCAVRFTHIGELCHQSWGNGLEHMRRVLTDHSTFPRAVCRHGGPDTDEYDQTVTMESSIVDFSNNRNFHRDWTAWKKFPCQVRETVTQYPPRPCDG